MKKVVFDSSWDASGGIGTFAKNVSSRLGGIEIFKFINSKPASPIATLLLSLRLLRFKSYVVVLPGYIPPVCSFGSFVFTIHDLNHIDRPENSSILRKIYYSFFISRGIAKSNSILTVSEFSRQRIINWSGASEDKVVNVGNGVDPAFNPNVVALELGSPYFLCVSNRKLHKNEPALLLAFSRAKIHSDVKLVFTGMATPELDSLISELDISDRVVFLGCVAESQLPSVYKGSLGLLFPSLYEGFGLPVVEAMACGVPVLTSNTTSLPEVAGDAALLVNPESVDEIRVGIERLVHDEALRTELIAKGLERAKLFSWDAVAARVQAVLDEVANQHAK